MSMFLCFVRQPSPLRFALVPFLKNPCFSQKNWMSSLCRARKILSRLAGFIGHRASGAKRPLLDFRVWPLLPVLVVAEGAVFEALGSFHAKVLKAAASSPRRYPHPPPTALNWIARRRAWITPTHKPCIKYKKGNPTKLLIYMKRHDQFLRVFVQ